MKRELTEEKEKKTFFSTDYEKQTNTKPYFNTWNRRNNTNSGYNNCRYGNKHYNNSNNKTYEQQFPQNNYTAGPYIRYLNDGVNRGTTCISWEFNP